MFKNEKGVTLVALIITIIVLLILAGVAFATLATNNGLLRRAGAAGNTWEEAAGNESNSLNESQDIMDNFAEEYNLWNRADFQ